MSSKTEHRALTADDEGPTFIRRAHQICGDLLEPHLSRYWLDFLVSIVIAHVSFAIYVQARAFSLAQAAAFAVCGLALYRSVVFTHELNHQRSRRFREFAIAWNVLCGIPAFVPAFMYGNHSGHHANQAYGTWADPEYLLRTSRWRGRILIFLLLSFVYPVMAAVRFLFLTPMALVSSRLDRLVWTYASSLYAMNEWYRREYDAQAHERMRWYQEVACCVLGWTIVALVVQGRIPATIVLQIYFVFLFWIALNQIRTLTAHRYTNAPDASMSYLDQVLDTNTFHRGKWLPHLWAPLGLRYHALHHLLPSLPYHAMGTAHRRLLDRLPPGSPYHRTLRPGLWQVLAATARDPRPEHRQAAPQAIHQ